MPAAKGLLSAFLTLIVICCSDGEHFEVTIINGDCEYDGQQAKNNEMVNLTHPCRRQICRNGEWKIQLCPVLQDAGQNCMTVTDHPNEPYPLCCPHTRCVDKRPDVLTADMVITRGITPKQENCQYRGLTVPSGETQRAQSPCVELFCKWGNMKITKCPAIIINNTRCVKNAGEAAPYPKCCPSLSCSLLDADDTATIYS
ncbi:uncharacterized protein LOC119399553 [Rhipicephalus sanguineus]|uniref:uncharacterized protein LOC119399553 n=1 Tax=Rhipicephalus sanguineus TaxID=34632 RepID=UPI00189343E0|nr:uncharacterized protein LOC119399553 [Rhipicephalus sanguineus]